MSVSFPPVGKFLLELDELKLVQRRSYIAGGVRLENSAEHSWHTAIAAWVLASYLDWDISVEKLLKLALIHDLGELDAGDTFLYAAERSNVLNTERQCVSRISKLHGGFISDLEALWDEQELGITIEARLLKVADRLLPFMHNLASDGKTWKQHKVARSQVLKAHGFIANEAPELFAWMEEQLEEAVKQGWLSDS